MPLTRSDDKVRADIDGVYFHMADGAKNVVCVVSYAALDDYVRGAQSRRERIAIFKANRSRIEQVASRMYHAGGAEPDGSIRIGTQGLNPDQFRVSGGVRR
jgi:uncharacterized protein DUF1488